MLIETKDDWWTLLETSWSNILDMAVQVGAPLGQNIDLDGKDMPISLLKQMEDAKTAKNWEVLSIFFNKVWWMLPDESSIHSIPGFHSLCDLCSETWVFQEEVDEFAMKTQMRSLDCEEENS